MENIEYLNSLYQICEIINYIEPNLKSRIPQKFITYCEDNKSKNYNWNIDKNLPLEKQELLPTTKEILTVLYLEFICTDIQKNELEKILNENEIKYQKELKEKYSYDSLFKNKQKKLENEKEEKENISVPACKESFLERIINKFKLFFHL